MQFKCEFQTISLMLKCLSLSLSLSLCVCINGNCGQAIEMRYKRTHKIRASVRQVSDLQSQSAQNGICKLELLTASIKVRE